MTCDFCNNDAILNFTGNKDAFCFCSIGEEAKAKKLKNLQKIIKETQKEIKRLENQNHDCRTCHGTGRMYVGDDCFIDCPECS